MRLGALLGPVLPNAGANFLVEQARTLAGEGFVSLWSAQAIGRGFMMTDPFVALAAAATAAERVEIGTAVVQAPLYQPLDLAHRVLSLQQICGNRLILGLGVGSTAKDFAALDRSFDNRFAHFASVVEDLKEIFTTGARGDNALSPWPAVAGGPPLFLGTWKKGVERAAREFDGWIASSMHSPTDQLVSGLETYRQAGGKRAVVSTILAPPGTDLGEFKARLDRFADAGFDDAVVLLLPGGPTPAQVRQLVD